MCLKYIIYTDGYDENVGGLIALHRLCDLINREGQKAYLWPAKRPVFDFQNPINSIRLFLKYFRRRLRKKFQTFPDFITPIAKYSDLKDAIVVYPELVDHNPLNAKYVVRWLLHKPGYHTGRMNYGKEDLFFYYLKAFDDPSVNSNPDNLLQTIFLRDDIYKQSNFGARNGTCYILRKGKNREIVHDLTNSILVDGLSHAEMAKVFNQVEMCISYDTYTMYSWFAAMCGCISVVVPEKDVRKDEWLPQNEKQYGLAYGFDDISYALETMPLLLSSVKVEEANSNKTVKDFIIKCEKYFQ